jgi:hypothetical protein
MCDDRCEEYEPSADEIEAHAEWYEEQLEPYLATGFDRAEAEERVAEDCAMYAESWLEDQAKDRAKERRRAMRSLFRLLSRMQKVPDYPHERWHSRSRGRGQERRPAARRRTRATARSPGRLASSDDPSPLAPSRRPFAGVAA